MKFVIRHYQDKDQQQVIDLILSIQRGEFNVPITIEDQPDVKNIPFSYQKGNGNFWVAMVEDKVVGTIGLIDIGKNQCALRKMFVHKNYRGKEIGVAKLLLSELITSCLRNGVNELILGTIDRMKAAHRFYERNGFKEVQKVNLPDNFPVMGVDNTFYSLSIKEDFLIYHIVSITDWNKFESVDYYEATSLRSEGFIHCSKRNQVEGVLERYYANSTNLLLLHINPLLLTAELKLEQSTNQEFFPHVFGRINKSAILEVEVLR